MNGYDKGSVFLLIVQITYKYFLLVQAGFFEWARITHDTPKITHNNNNTKSALYIYSINICLFPYLLLLYIILYTLYTFSVYVFTGANLRGIRSHFFLYTFVYFLKFHIPN